MTNMRRILSTPSPSLRMADGGNFLTRFIAGTPVGKTLRGRDAAIEQAVSPPPPPAPPPAPAKPARTVADIRFKNGGALRTGMGGHVPGEGEGDKIDAKYEPGEFVVSNDMLDAAPQLREQLSGLRGQVLAAKGMTPEEADAKSIVPGGLRAQTGIDPYVNHRAPNGPPISPPPAQIGYTPPVASTAVATTPYRPNFTYGDVEFKQPPPSPDFGNEAQARARAAAAARATASAAASAPAAPAAPAAPVPAGKMQAAVNGAGTVLKGVGRVARVAAPLMEAKDIYDVAADANSTKIDVGTQVAEGASKLAMAGLGAKAGAAAGLPLGPVGAAAGGLIGGGLGYFGGEKLIGGLRQLTGSDPRSPDEQINARKADAAADRPTPPAAPGSLPAGTDRPAPGSLPAGTTLREPGIYETRRPGQSVEFGDEASLSDTRFRNRGAISAQNMAAADALDARYAGERASLRNREAQAADERAGGMSQSDLLRMATSPGKVGGTWARQMLLEQVRDRTTRRGQDMTQAAASATTASSAATTQAKKAEDDRKYQLDVARLGIETANKNRDDKRAGEEAFDRRVLGMVGTDKEGKPDTGAASAARNTMNAFLAKRQAAALAALKENPNDRQAAGVLKDIEDNGLAGIDEQTLREVLLDQKVKSVAKKGAGPTPWGGTAANSDRPLRSLSFKDSWLPFADKYEGDNGLVLTDDDFEANPDFRQFLGAKAK